MDQFSRDPTRCELLNLDRDLLTNRCFIELAGLLYWKKRNATNADQPGPLRRLIAVMRKSNSVTTSTA